MRYHDAKLREASLFAAMASVAAVLFLLGVILRHDIEPLVNRLPLKTNQPFWPLMAALLIIALLFGWMTVWYLRTSPAENAEYIDRMTRKHGREPDPKFDPSLLDPSDPDFEVSTWEYLKRRSRS